MSNIIIKRIKYVFIILFLSIMTVVSIPKSAFVCVNAEEIVDTLEIYYQYYSSEAGTYVASENSEEFFNNVNSNSKIEVVYEFEYDYESNLMQNFSSELSEQEITNLLSQHRQTSKEYFVSKNNEFLLQNNFDLLSNNYTISISHFAPYIVFTYNNLDCLQANFLDAINVDSAFLQSIFINEKLETTSEATREHRNSASIYPMSQVREDVGVYDNDFTGNGINIGMIENGSPLAHCELNGKSIDIYNLNIDNNNATNYDYEHATNVARTLVGSKSLAPNSNLHSYPLGQWNLIDALNEIIAQQNIQLVNMSCGYNNYNYVWQDAYFDYLSRNHGITFVKSAGNYDSLDKPNYKITAPGLGYNVITVGNMNVNKKIDNTSCYNVNSSLNLRKPTVVAPGTWIETTWPGTNGKGRYGTSFSAPIVTGVIARLMEEFPILLGRPDMVQTCIIASATPVNGQTEDSWDTHAGAGCINYERARQAVQNAIMFENDNHIADTEDPISSNSINIASNNQIKIVACWLANSRTINDTSIINNNIHTNYNIKIRNTNLESNHNSNVEVLWYTPTSNQVTIDIIQKEDMADENHCDDIGTVTWIYDDSPYITEVVDEEVAITGVTRPISGKAVIPSKIGQQPVVSIGNQALLGQTGINKVVISSNVKEIGNQAFENCVNLTNVTFLDNSQLTTIGNSAFEGCSSLVGINASNEIILPNSITSISPYLFAGCSSITKITMSENVTEIGEYAFLSCKKLVGINHDSRYFIPSGVSVISEGAFEDCAALTGIDLPSVITSIGAYAFKFCNNLLNISLPNGVESIGEYAFMYCSKLTNLVVPNSVNAMGMGVIEGCTSLTSLSIPFVGNNATANQWTTLSYLFGNPTINIYQSLKTVKVTNTEIIGSQAFSGCSYLEEIVLPSTLTQIGSNAFAGCSGLEEITLPDGLLSIGTGAFLNCSGLTGIIIPASVTTIESEAFLGCGAIEWISFKRTQAMGITQIGAVAFGISINGNLSKYPNLTIIYVPDEASQNAYMTAANLSLYAEYICYGTPWLRYELVNDYYVVEQGEEELNGVVVIASKYNGKEVKGIKNNAFNGCGEITEIVIPASIIEIGEGAFAGCSGLTNITVNANNAIYKSEGNCLIEKSTNKLIVAGNNSIIPSDVQIIGAKAFYGRTGLQSITIPASVTEIATNAFYGCAGLERVIITDNVNTIGENAFYGCENLTIYTEKQSTPSGWHSNWNSSGRPVVWDCELSDDNSYVISIGTISNSTATNGISEPYKAGDSFGGWYNSSYFVGEGYSMEQIATAESGVYYAKWTNSVKTITYDLAGGTGNYISFLVNNGTQIEEPEIIPEKQYMEFMYWALSTDLTQEYDWESPVTEDITLVAVWEYCDVTEDLEYNLIFDGTAYEVGRGSATDTTIVIPYRHNGLPVIRIKDNGFYDSNITDIKLSENIQIIGYGAFSYCSSLQNVTIEPNSSLTYIDYYAFCNCNSLQSIAIPASVTFIGEGAFWNCTAMGSVMFEDEIQLSVIQSSVFENCSSLESITIPNSVETISSEAFYGCTFESFAIPASVTYISPTALRNNVFLTSIAVAEGNENYSASDGILYDYNKTQVIKCPEGKVGIIALPASIQAIGDYAFYGCSGVTSISIPAGVTNIGNYSFYNCTSLESFTIAEESDLNSIGNYAFYGCSGLTSIAIPANVTEIGEYVFYGCTLLNNVALNEGLESIGKLSFANCTSLSSISIPSNVTSIGDRAFYMCSSMQVINVAEVNSKYCVEDNVLYSVNEENGSVYYTAEFCPQQTQGAIELLENTSEIKEYAFYGCAGITSVTIPIGVTKIDAYAFYGCAGITSVTIPIGVTKIDAYAFYGCAGIMSVTIPATVTEIGNYAFYNCASLESFTIAEESALNSIGYYAFANCSIVEIEIPVGVVEMGSYVFAGWESNQTINIAAPITVLETWSMDWITNSDAQVEWINNSYENGTIGLQYTLIDYGTDGGYEVSVGNSITSIYMDIVIPATYNGLPVVKIADYGFYDLYELENVIILGTNLVTIGRYAFAESNYLKKINIPNSVMYIEEYAFMGCRQLNSINLSSTLVSIGYKAFEYCADRITFTVSDWILTVDYGAFNGKYTIFAEVESWEVYGWNLEQMPNCTIFWNCELGDEETYVISIGEDNHIISQTYWVAEPYREGYEFMGWTTVENSTVVEYSMLDLYQGEFMYGEDLKLYAVWEPIVIDD